MALGALNGAVAGQGPCLYYNPFSNAIQYSDQPGSPFENTSNPDYVAGLANPEALRLWLNEEVDLDLLRRHGISKTTFFKWRSKYAGASVSDVKRLRELDGENAKLKRMYAGLALENAAIKDVLARKWSRRPRNDRRLRCGRGASAGPPTSVSHREAVTGGVLSAVGCRRVGGMPPSSRH